MALKPPFLSLPPTDDSPDVAARWAHEVALARLSSVADDAREVTRNLVKQAIPRTPADQMIQVTIVTDTLLRVEVRDPNQPCACDGLWLGESTLITRSMGTEATTDGVHLAWAELRPSLAATG